MPMPIYGPLSAAEAFTHSNKDLFSVTTKTRGLPIYAELKGTTNMLVMCIHLPSQNDIYAVPGALLPNKTFSGRLLGSTEDGNTDYIVQPEELATFLRELACYCFGREKRMAPGLSGLPT